MEGESVGYNFERDPPKNHPCQVWLNLVQGFRGEDLNVKVYDRCQVMAKAHMAFGHREKGDKRWWWCTKRGKNNRCAAAVSQTGDRFVLGRYPHDHPPNQKRFSMEGVERQVKDIISTLYTCSPLDDNDDDLDLTNESNNSDVQQTPTNGQPPDSGSPSKKRKAESEVESDVQQELIKIERQRLLVDKERLRVEKQRLQIEKQRLEKTNKRLEIETQRLEETKKYNSQCTCMNQTIQQPVMNQTIQQPVIEKSEMF